MKFYVSRNASDPSRVDCQQRIAVKSSIYKKYWLFFFTYYIVIFVTLGLLLTIKPALAGDMDAYYFCTPLGLKVMDKEVDEYYRKELDEARRGLKPNPHHPRINFITDKYVNTHCNFDNQVKIMKEFGFKQEFIIDGFKETIVDRGPNEISLKLPMFRNEWSLFGSSLQLIIEHKGNKIISVYSIVNNTSL
jgi:hypothetical protein